MLLTLSFSLFAITFSSCDHKKLASSKVKFTSGDIPQEVYVWQRVWTNEVKSAVDKRAVEFKKTIHLAAEISYRNERWSCQPFHHSGNHTPAFRIHSDAARSRWDDSAAEQITSYLEQHSGGAESIQLDYDCPSKKLADYTKLLIHIRKKLPSKSLEITCLPDWLNYSEFESLIQQTDRFIMQVHGVSGHGKGRALCNPDHAYKTALTCAKYGKPYLIALPTYRHAVSYSTDGKVKSIASEGHYEKTSYEMTSADPFQLSHLMQRWQAQRPELMQGVIWYRLPVSTDRMNWTWHTFQKVRHGEPLVNADLSLSIITNPDGLHQLKMTNNSEQRLDWIESIQLNWLGFCIASQLTDQFKFETIERSKGCTILWKKSSPYPIAPGESITVGSFRFTEPAPTIEIITP